MRKAVFLDRDGVLNAAVVVDGKPFPPQSLEAFSILSDAPEAALRLKSAGYRLIVVTNQPDIRTGRQSRSVVEAMHRRLKALLPLDAIEMCCHADGDGCTCRKPLPGMLLSAAAALRIDLPRSWMIGDRWRDHAAGRAAGCRTIRVAREYDEPAGNPDFTVGSLAEAAELIIACDIPTAGTDIATGSEPCFSPPTERPVHRGKTTRLES